MRYHCITLTHTAAYTNTTIYNETGEINYDCIDVSCIVVYPGRISYNNCVSYLLLPQIFVGIPTISGTINNLIN